MKIILMRHGKPDIPYVGKLRGNEIGKWVDIYNSANLCRNHLPDPEAIKMGGIAKKVICSDLRRSVESAELLGIQDVSVIDPVFRELSFPFYSFRSPALSPYVWASIYRALWLVGYSRNGESIRDARARAASAAEILSRTANDNGSVLLIGHWFLNSFIARELRAGGWKGPAIPSKKYWAFGVYEFAT